tara:strand:+ start:2564 stop:3994 length:1431 start_codon:yes stop_codon:yes gene_type:complete
MIIFLIGILLGCAENIDVCDENNTTGSLLFNKESAISQFRKEAVELVSPDLNGNQQETIQQLKEIFEKCYNTSLDPTTYHGESGLQLERGAGPFGQTSAGNNWTRENVRSPDLLKQSVSSGGLLGAGVGRQLGFGGGGRGGFGNSDQDFRDIYPGILTTPITFETWLSNLQQNLEKFNEDEHVIAFNVYGGQIPSESIEQTIGDDLLGENLAVPPGQKSSNVVIDKSFGAPKITKIGVDLFEKIRAHAVSSVAKNNPRIPVFNQIGVVGVQQQPESLIVFNQNLSDNLIKCLKNNPDDKFKAFLNFIKSVDNLPVEGLQEGFLGSDVDLDASQVQGFTFLVRDQRIEPRTGEYPLVMPGDNILPPESYEIAEDTATESSNQPPSIANSTVYRSSIAISDTGSCSLLFPVCIKKNAIQSYLRPGSKELRFQKETLGMQNNLGKINVARARKIQKFMYQPPVRDVSGKEIEDLQYKVC